eukprot:8602369-Pyramimonas_sp.AAC.1
MRGPSKSRPFPARPAIPPESFSDSPGAQRGAPEAEHCQEPPVATSVDTRTCLGFEPRDAP